MSEVAAGRRDGADGAVVERDVSLAAVGSKPKPLIVIVGALAARLAVLAVTTGVTVATWTAAPLLTPSAVTMAVKLPTWSAPSTSFTVRESRSRP